MFKNLKIVERIPNRQIVLKIFKKIEIRLILQIPSLQRQTLKHKVKTANVYLQHEITRYLIKINNLRTICIGSYFCLSGTNFATFHMPFLNLFDWIRFESISITLLFHTNCFIIKKKWISYFFFSISMLIVKKIKN